MKFTDLVFDQQGCCGTHVYAVVRHDNGSVSTVYDNGDGTWDVVTHAVGMLMRAQRRYESQAEVETRLAEDAS